MKGKEKLEKVIDLLNEIHVTPPKEGDLLACYTDAITRMAKTQIRIFLIAELLDEINESN